MYVYCRYSPHGRWATEENIQWHRLRMPPIDISPQTLHISDCLADLRPGDHIEIQWRRNREFPYGIFQFLNILFSSFQFLFCFGLTSQASAICPPWVPIHLSHSHMYQYKFGHYIFPYLPVIYIVIFL